MKKYVLFLATLLTMMACQESLEEKAANEAKTYTRKNCPVTLSASIVLDSMTFDKNTHTFGYHYTMRGEMDTISAIEPDRMRKQLLDGVKNMTAAKAYMDKGYGFRYVYHSEKEPAKVLFETLFTEKDYK